MAIDPKKLEELKRSHGDVYSLKACGYEFLFKSPGEGEWQMFLDTSADQKKRPRAMRTLVEACLLHPDIAVLADAVSKRPAIVMSFGGKLGELAGIDEEAEMSKL